MKREARRFLWRSMLLVGAATVAGVTAVWGGADSAAGPLAQHGLAEGRRFQVDGRVRERLTAGSYTYLRLEAENGRGVWVATMGEGQPTGTDVHVLVFGRAQRFASKRLGRTFQDLHFGIVTR